jgi:hypothetical protein
MVILGIEMDVIADRNCLTTHQNTIDILYNWLIYLLKITVIFLT